MNDDGTNIIVFQQCRDLVFGDWTSAAISVPRGESAGGGWPEQARRSAIYLSRAPYEPSVRVQLLAALRAMFTKNGTEITSEQVVQELLAHPDSEWIRASAWKHVHGAAGFPSAEAYKLAPRTGTGQPGPERGPLGQ